MIRRGFKKGEKESYFVTCESCENEIYIVCKEGEIPEEIKKYGWDIYTHRRELGIKHYCPKCKVRG